MGRAPLPSAEKKRRKQAGAWLRSLRQAQGLTQIELAKCVKINPPATAFIAQVESGLDRVPNDRFEIWADALGVQPREFAITLMSYYNKPLHDLLFGGESQQPAPRKVPKRVVKPSPGR